MGKAVGQALLRWDGRPALIVAIVGLFGLALLTAVFHAMGSLPAFEVAFFLPVWLATQRDGRRGGILSVMAVSIMLTLLSTRAGEGIEEATASLVVRFAVFGSLMLLVARGEERGPTRRGSISRDPLTGLPVRSALDDGSAANRSSLAMIDCDRFKQVNDTHGHQAGDLVLRLLARALERGIRDSDTVIRFGGDEFLVLFDRATIVQAEGALLRIRDTFERLTTDAGYGCTFSCGIASLRDAGGLERALASADRQMYIQKRARRSTYLR